MSSPKVLAPHRDDIPAELKKQSSWILWQITKDGRKVPFCPETLKPVNVNSSRVGSDFETVWSRYKSCGRFSGIGFVLGGYIGIDLDNCLSNRAVLGDAIEFLKRLGCQYVEYSPRGKGLRGFGKSVEGIRDTNGFYKNQRVEVYDTKGYMTVTGHIYKEFPQSGEIAWLDDHLGVLDEVTFLLPTQDTEVSNDTEDSQVTDLNHARARSNDKILDHIPQKAIPVYFGQRNHCLFHLARFLKKELPDSSVDDLLLIVHEWFEKYNSVISTKDFGVTAAEFRYCFDRVKFLEGDVLQAALAQREELPQWMSAQRYGPKAEALLRVLTTYPEPLETIRSLAITPLAPQPIRFQVVLARTP